MTAATTAPTAVRLISADDHVDVSHEQVKSFLASEHHDDYDGAFAAFAASMGPMLSVEANARWREQAGLAEPDRSVGMGTNRRHPAFGRTGHTDPDARLADMDADGVEASVSYCEVSAFRYLYLLRDGGPAATRAFNHALQRFAAPDPARLVVSFQIPIHDIDAAVAEVRWAATTGCRSLQLPVFPAELGLPDYWDRRYDPLWSAVQDAGLPICLHIGLTMALEDLARRDPTPQKGVFVPMTALSAAEALGMWVLTGVLERFRELKLVFVEPGIGWVAWWLTMVDDMQARQGYDFPGLQGAPSEYFHRNVHLTFVDEPDVVRHAEERIGIENVLWSSDYPHPVSSWPRSQAIVTELFAGVPAAQRDLICHGNAARVWGL